MPADGRPAALTRSARKLQPCVLCVLRKASGPWRPTVHFWAKDSRSCASGWPRAASPCHCASCPVASALLSALAQTRLACSCLRSTTTDTHEAPGSCAHGAHSCVPGHAQAPRSEPGLKRRRVCTMHQVSMRASSHVTCGLPAQEQTPAEPRQTDTSCSPRTPAAQYTGRMDGAARPQDAVLRRNAPPRDRPGAWRRNPGEGFLPETWARLSCRV